MEDELDEFNRYMTRNKKCIKYIHESKKISV